jgi:hypothetical protein
LATFKQAAFGIVVSIAAVVAIGYATAWLSLDACARDTLELMRRLPFEGCDVQGRPIALARYDVHAKVMMPFLVFAVGLPRDSVGSTYAQFFIVMPWARYRQQPTSPQSGKCPW